MRNSVKAAARKYAGAILVLGPALLAVIVYLAAKGLLYLENGYHENTIWIPQSAAGISCILAYILLALWEIRKL